MIYQIAYVGLSTTAMTADLLSNILDVSQRNNVRDRISGALLYHDRLFFQVLEGELAPVRDCYARICRDARLRDISLVWEGETDKRSFAGWAMGFAGPDDVGRHTDLEMETLADLKSGSNTTAASDDLALHLATEMYKFFIK